MQKTNTTGMKTALEIKRQFEKTRKPLNQTMKLKGNATNASKFKLDASTLQSTNLNKETLFEKNTERLSDIISTINYMDNSNKRSPTKGDLLLEDSIESNGDQTLFGGIS